MLLNFEINYLKIITKQKKQRGLTRLCTFENYMLIDKNDDHD